MKETLNGKNYEIVTRNLCAGCHFFDGDEAGCQLPDGAEIGCDADTITN